MIRPGWTALTRTPSAARSFESVFSIPWTEERSAFERMSVTYAVGMRTVVEVE